ncbi:MAG: LytTR family DNA-binding domain-containing protein [Sulfitobacter sp.]
MQFTRRQWQRVGAYAMLWILLSALCAVAGPFGTHAALGFIARAAYWAVVVGVSIAGAVLSAQVRPQGSLTRLLAWVLYVVALTFGIFAINALLFEDSSGVYDLAYLVVIVGLSVGAINGLIHLARYMVKSNVPPQDLVTDPQARFLRRLPIETRGALIRIEAQDHYLNVITAKGNALILLRLAEAVAELEGAGGLQVHRSHWVSLDAVQSHRRSEGRDILQVSDGSSIPVARTRRDAARAAGLF